MLGFIYIKKRQLLFTELSVMYSLCTHRLEHREQTERGLDGGAVDKLLVGLGEDSLLNLHKPLLSINIQFSGFSLHFLFNNQ